MDGIALPATATANTKGGGGAGGSRYAWFVTSYPVNKEHWYVDISYFLYFTLV